MGKRLLLVEPYYGGSHRQFLDGLRKHIIGDCTVWTLPPRKWKMRMQLAAPWFARQVEVMAPEDRFFDTILFSTFIDVAVFKALVQGLPGWNNACRYLTYFHENQFNYPGILPKETLHQFTAVNFTTALVSDSIAFNSHYNKDSFIAHCSRYLAKAGDIDLNHVPAELEAKSLVLYPGIDFTPLDSINAEENKRDIPLIVWNHRWEHDKNPDEFFEALAVLAEGGISFRLALLGQHFRDSPLCFFEARKRFADRIIHFGFLEDRQDYYRVLRQGDVVVSTARHEFFGISVIEAVRAGCIPVLPHRLSYPELFAGRYLYPEGHLVDHLQKVLVKGGRLSAEQRNAMTSRFDWQQLSAQYQNWLGIHVNE